MDAANVHRSYIEIAFSAQGNVEDLKTSPGCKDFQKFWVAALWKWDLIAERCGYHTGWREESFDKMLKTWTYNL